MRKLALIGILLCLVGLGAGACWADMMASHLGHQGPAFAPGMMPSTLGWGADDKAYPDKFIVNPQDGEEMAWVPAGQFMMGSTREEQDYAYGWLQKAGGWLKKAIGNPAKKERLEDEQPAHLVRLTKGFWLGKCDVTNAQYRAFCQAAGRAFPEQSKSGPNHPVVWVSWEDAKAYCDQYGLVLPTEAQWEYAARGPESRYFPWGKEWDPKRCCNGDNKGPGDPPTMEVGSLPVGDSWCGASDMAGNVWEWCVDLYDEGYYAKSPQDDPPGPSSGGYRVLRGGSWDNGPGDCRSAFRLRGDTTAKSLSSGFRCVRTP